MLRFHLTGIHYVHEWSPPNVELKQGKPWTGERHYCWWEQRIVVGNRDFGEECLECGAKKGDAETVTRERERERESERERERESERARERESQLHTSIDT